jgi:hypothetical protein
MLWASKCYEWFIMLTCNCEWNMVLHSGRVRDSKVYQKT